jgi:crotonobetainyl-CoA:carnitine CoA-transferase CaiB-like acyl-CoA transferase
LAGLRVLDLSIIVAGGTASSLMADFGAEVVKVERPGSGDPLRNWGPFYNGVSLWWKVHSRNKQSITLNMADGRGQTLLKDLARQADVLIEGFRPGTLERWGLGPADLHDADVNPGLVMLRFSGFGQTGPYKDRPGFGTIAECMSGYIGMTGFPDTPPNLPPVPLADEIAGVFGAMAGMMAIYRRDADRRDGRPGNGQVVDLSLFEPLFRLCIPHLTIYDRLGEIRERVGNDFPDAAPRSLFRTGDERWLGLSATSQNTWERLAQAMGLPDLVADPRFADNAARLENKDALNDILQEWLGRHTLEQSLEQLVPAGGVVGPVYDSAQIVADPHYQERQDVVEVDDPELGPTLMPGVVPKFSDTPGAVEYAGPRLGEHNQQVYGSWLGYAEETLRELAGKGVI